MQIALAAEVLDTVCSFLPSRKSHNSVLKWLWSFFVIVGQLLGFLFGAFWGAAVFGFGFGFFLVAFQCF